jgi:hypothetical protein
MELVNSKTLTPVEVHPVVILEQPKVLKELSGYLVTIPDVEISFVETITKQNFDGLNYTAYQEHLYALKDLQGRILLYGIMDREPKQQDRPKCISRLVGTLQPKEWLRGWKMNTKVSEFVLADFSEITQEEEAASYKDAAELITKLHEAEKEIELLQEELQKARR